MLLVAMDAVSNSSPGPAPMASEINTGSHFGPRSPRALRTAMVEAVREARAMPLGSAGLVPYTAAAYAENGKAAMARIAMFRVPEPVNTATAAAHANGKAAATSGSMGLSNPAGRMTEAIMSGTATKLACSEFLFIDAPRQSQRAGFQYRVTIFTDCDDGDALEADRRVSLQG